jgi:transposase
MEKKRHDAAFKAKAALEAVKGEKTLTQLASEYGIHPNQIGQWKKRLLKELPTLFSGDKSRQEKERGDLEDELYRQIGQLKVELEWLKKKSKLLG